MQLSFVKGHCGWDTATLLLADEIPQEEQLSTALQVLGPPFDGGIEAGLLQADSRPGYLRLRVVDTTSRTWISMCGGITQLIGKALVETGFRDYFDLDGGLDSSFDDCNGSRRLTLTADAGDFPLDIEVKDGSVLAVTTTMDAYAAYLYGLGVHPASIDGVHALVVGEFLVFRIADLQSRHHGVDFTRRDAGPQLDIVNSLLRGHQERSSHLNGVLAMLYDDGASGGGHFRVYPRFLGGDDSAARLPFEFQCGTGTVAVALALLHYGELPFDVAEGEAIFEWGNPSNTRDPYGIRTSAVRIGAADGRIRRISFSHSVVEIIAEGKLSVPEAIRMSKC